MESVTESFLFDMAKKTEEVKDDAIRKKKHNAKFLYEYYVHRQHTSM